MDFKAFHDTADSRSSLAFTDRTRKKNRPGYRSNRFKAFRQLTYSEQSGLCHYCQKHINFDVWTTDHKVPLSRDGTSERTNLIGACRTCNNEKGNRTELEYFEFRRLTSS